MQELDIKHGHYKKIEGDKLENIMTEYFGDVIKEDDWLVANFGAMRPITVRIIDKKTLGLDITTSTDVDDETAMETIRAKNGFLEDITGFTAKQRRKRLKDKAKKGKL